MHSSVKRSFCLRRWNTHTGDFHPSLQSDRKRSFTMFMWMINRCEQRDPFPPELVCRFWSQTLDFPTFRLYSASSLQASPIFLRASSPSCISRCCSWRLSLRRRWLSCFESSDSGVTPCTWRWSCMSYGCCWSPPVKALSYVSITFIL